MKNFETYEDAVKSESTKIGSIQESRNKSVSFTCDEQLPEEYNLKEEFDTIVEKHLEPLKAFALQKGMPFMIVAIPARFEEGYQSFALGYMPGARTTPLMKKVMKIVEAEKENKLYDAEAQAIIDLGETIKKRIADAFEKGTPKMEEISDIIHTTISVKLMMLLMEASDNKAKTACDLLSRLVEGLDSKDTPEATNASEEPLPKIDEE